MNLVVKGIVNFKGTFKARIKMFRRSRERCSKMTAMAEQIMLNPATQLQSQSM